MAVKKLFWEDPYLEKVMAVITGLNGNTITLDKTVFYAFSGGQASDSGTIADIKVIEAKKIDREIFYTLESTEGINVGDNVLVSIDWNKRYKIMRLHFAAEIILELVYQNYNRPEKLGANISEDKARIDFFFEGNISGIFSDLIKRAKDIIDANLPIKSSFSDIENEKRYWEIEGFAKVSCGGTHIRHTGEIGSINLKRRRNGINNERIEIYL
ncbi:MAG: alanyl-tRNA editing protein [archaeon]